MESDKPTELTGVDLPEPEEKRCEGNRLPELRLVLLGWRWPGKSLTGNTILGREEFHLERAAEFSVKRETEVDGRKVTIVDTPGWFSAQATPMMYQKEMLRSVSMCSPGPHAFLLVVPVGMFTETDRVRIEENLALFGEDVWKHTLLVFTWAEILKQKTIERHIRREGRELQWVVDKCKKRYCVINNHIFGDHRQLPSLMENIEKLVAEEAGPFRPQTEENTAQSQTSLKANNENLNPNAAKEERELGARPKRNCSFSLLQPGNEDGPQNLIEGVSD
ncbi:GTPase IMAP family member 4 isoform X1 [Electrophorus electricus]|uniref:AIG1-type G domain-containing protein n=1 Tax=Electrophorus electricus TaxID=8005 RepID=A0A4W4EUF0_ELEEL|nr:GTPase IMAP family member 4 isoform X1 [Electrophorus electricus]